MRHETVYRQGIPPSPPSPPPPIGKGHVLRRFPHITVNVVSGFRLVCHCLCIEIAHGTSGVVTVHRWFQTGCKNLSSWQWIDSRISLNIRYALSEPRSSWCVPLLPRPLEISPSHQLETGALPMLFIDSFKLSTASTFCSQYLLHIAIEVSYLVVR